MAVAEPRSTSDGTSTMTVESAAIAPDFVARIVGYDMPAPQEAVLVDATQYQLNMCLTPRPIYARASFHEVWGPRRQEPLGEIFLIPPGKELLVRGGAGQQATLVCHFSALALNRAIGQTFEWTSQRLETALDIANTRIRSLLFRLTEEVRHPGIAADQMVDCLARQLEIELGRHFIEIVEKPIAGGLAAWRLRLIDERLEAAPTAPGLAELARLCGLSVRQLTRGFRVSRGATIGAYVEQYRMEAAKRQLLAGDSVKAIAFAMGFASPSSFTFAFRRATGVSPRTFRARNRLPGAT